MSELLSAALLGTARTVPSFEDLATGELAHSVSGDPAETLLGAAALENAYRDGGVAASARVLPAPAEDDPRLQLPPGSASHLMQLLAAKSWTLTEWFAVVAERDYRAPDHLVADLMTSARTNDTHRESILRLVGSRGQWLAAQNPDWSMLVRRSDRTDVWTHGAHQERLQWLTTMRAVNPAIAMAELSRTWDSERGEHRAAFIAVLGTGLSDADSALLEHALDDRRKEVRQQAVQLLRQLPNSAYAGRMAARARAWVRVEKKPLRTRLVVNMPGSLDDSARRDGIEDVHFKNKGIRSWWLRMVVTAAPLSVWEGMIGSASTALEIRIEDQWREVMMEAWTTATVLQRNPRWASALLHREGRKTERRVVPIVPARERLAYILSGRADSYLLGVDGAALFDGLPHPWPLDLAERVIARLEDVAGRHAETGKDLGQFSRHSHYSTLRSAETHFPFAAAPILRAAAERTRDPGWHQAFATVATNIDHRRTVLKELE
ncbi:MULTISPECIES: DUF5691 domain-containing protein [Rhodococcus]|uniref:DUF5691 domain-containing protein n=1 Tax=Rhodococcus TaxID=1827 RepID=UPI0006BB530C|nr:MULTISPECIES: DUF5691 domain-containing protein [Rhodococcus]NHU43949.1 hypothetical protein [Rhodococcus sp. A14]MBA8962753.1 hypothetical protein [Rhodococcus opacus]MBP2208718.1 hypothetical protein [Rhodococcus opacus]MDI9935482.1 DUF5691 domain-containing protein [Rhodococcus sp. IEGM 1351]MDV6239944.1 DUF5691 domain-containing protein [Rhodococcus opacus]